MAFHENTCDAFTTAFAALSLVLAVAATGGSSWVAYELYGYDQVEAGLWEFCEGEGGLRECLPYSSVKGNILVAEIGMVTITVLLLLGLIMSIIKKCSQFSEHGHKVIAGILTSLMLLGAAAGITALACFTAETNKAVTVNAKVHYGWSYFSGWFAVVFTCACIRSSIASLSNRRTNVQVGSNMQVVVPNTYVTSVPYNQFTVSTNTNRVI